MRNLALIALVAATSFGGVYGILRPQVVQTALASTNCSIKGNVSYSGGQRIYHVPGQYYYDETVITPSRGERWFCSEAEAVAAGWRRAGY
jgi:hypothetical protein